MSLLPYKVIYSQVPGIRTWVSLGTVIQPTTLGDRNSTETNLSKEEFVGPYNWTSQALGTSGCENGVLRALPFSLSVFFFFFFFGGYSCFTMLC